MESDVTTTKWDYNPNIAVLGYGAIPYEGKKNYLFKKKEVSDMARNYQLSKIAKKYLKKAQNKKEEKEEVRGSQTPNNTSKKENVPTKDNPLTKRPKKENVPTKDNPLTKRPKKENKKPEVDHKQLHKKLGWFIPLEKINKILRRNPLCIIP